MIVEQRLTPDEIYVKFNNGNVFSKTRAEIAALRQGRTKNQVLALLRTELAAAGGDQIDLTFWAIDFDNNGGPTALKWEKP